MHHLGIIGWIIIGGLAGWIASMVMNRHHGVIVNVVIGLIGALIGGWINGHFIHFAIAGHVYIADFVIAFIGAVILLAILGLINRPRDA